MAKNQSYLGDAYTASKARRPMDLGGSTVGGATAGGASSGLPPPMMLGGPSPVSPAPAAPPLPQPGVTPPSLSGMPALSGAAGVGQPPRSSGAMQSLIAAMQHAHTVDSNQNGIPDSQEKGGGAGVPAMPSLGLGAPPTGAPQPTTLGMRAPGTPVGGGPSTDPRRKYVPPTRPAGGPPTGTPTAPAMPGPDFWGPNPPPGYGPPVTPGHTTQYNSPSDVMRRMIADMLSNPEGWRQYGLFNSTAPGAAALSQLGYLLADPYNRQITDSAEKNALEGTNTAFDAARGRMRSDALQSGAGGSGVARGQSQALELARGAQQAKNVRDFEQQKVDLGDKRLRELGLPLLAQYNASRGNQTPPQQGPNWGEELLPIALSLLAA